MSFSESPIECSLQFHDLLDKEILLPILLCTTQHYNCVTMLSNLISPFGLSVNYFFAYMLYLKLLDSHSNLK